MSWQDAAGLVGVLLVLLAYAGAALGKLNPEGVMSLSANLAGACLILLSLLSRNRPRLFLCVLSIIFVVLSTQAARNVPFVALLLVPVVGAAAAARWPGARRDNDSHLRVSLAFAAALTIVGHKGDCGLVVDGSALDQSVATVAADIPAALARIAREVAPGEKAADTLARLGVARIAAILRANPHG